MTIYIDVRYHSDARTGAGKLRAKGKGRPAETRGGMVSRVESVG